MRLTDLRIRFHVDLALASAGRAGLIAAAAALSSSAALADQLPPTVSLALRDTADLWFNVDGGRHTGGDFLNKLQVSATFQSDRLGLSGITVHGQVFHTNGSSLSRKVGDIQTVDSIEARPVTRLFESWVEKKFGDADSSLAIRGGLIDLNADFDSIQAPSLFVNSSHGIGADLSRSGINGPSIYPVSAAGLRVSWHPSKQWTFRAAAFDGISGDPHRPKAVVSAKLARADGLLAIGQVDYHFSDTAKIELGAWRYSETRPAVDPASLGPGHDQGLYGSLEGPIPGAKGWSAWVRAGLANGRAQIINRYLGGGGVRQGLIEGRPDDRLGIAVAQAGIGREGRAAFGLPRAETTIEVTYQYRVHNSFALQPDVQYVIHPATQAGTRNAFVFGLRLVLTAGYPRQAPATEATDPTVPPDGPQPGDGSSPP